MKVWVVRQDDYDSTEALSVWSTRELAEAEMKRLRTAPGPPPFNAGGWMRVAIDEFTVDEPF